MTRYDYLISQIHAIKADGSGSNNDLAAYCGASPTQTSAWFWTAAPKLRPRADITLSALRWACDRANAQNVPIPDWPTLRFHFFLSLYADRYAQDAIRIKSGQELDPFPASGGWRSAARWASILEVSPERVVELAPYPWGEAPEPDGAFALDLLAACHQPEGDRRRWIEFISVDLEDRAPEGVVACGFPGGITPLQRALIGQASQHVAYDKISKRNVPHYHVEAITNHPWLVKILL